MSEDAPFTGDVWELIDELREQGWCLELNNNGVMQRTWSARFTNWGRDGEPKVQGEDWTAFGAALHAYRLIKCTEELRRREREQKEAQTCEHIWTPHVPGGGMACQKCGEPRRMRAIRPHIPGWNP